MIFYQEIVKKTLEHFENSKSLPKRRLPNFGEAVRIIQKRARIKASTIARICGLNRKSLHTILSLGESNMHRDQFLKLLKGLSVSPEDFLELAKEYSTFDFFHLKPDQVPLFQFDKYEAQVLSPPCPTSRDFMWCLIRLKPGQSIPDVTNPFIKQVAGFVINGSLRLTYHDETKTLHTNQTFFFDPKLPHSFSNNASLSYAEFFLIFSHPPSMLEYKETETPKTAVEFDVANVIHQIRRELSPDPEEPTPLPHLASLSGINKDALAHLIYRGTKIIPFDKLDSLANLTHYNCKEITQLANGKYPGWCRIYTENDKSSTDLSMHSGVMINNHTSIGVGKRQFSILEIVFGSVPQGKVGKRWSYQGCGYLGILVEKGFLAVEYGSRPKQLLKWGECLYISAETEIEFSNALSEEEAERSGESDEVKALIFSSPAIF